MNRSKGIKPLYSMEVPKPAATRVPPYNGTEFKLWVTRFHSWTRVQGLWPFFDGTQVKPAPITGRTQGTQEEILEKLEELQLYELGLERAFDALLSAMEKPEHQRLIVEFAGKGNEPPNPHEAWKRLEAAHVVITETSFYRVSTELMALKMKQGESVLQYWARERRNSRDGPLMLRCHSTHSPSLPLCLKDSPSLGLLILWWRRRTCPHCKRMCFFPLCKSTRRTGRRGTGTGKGMGTQMPSLQEVCAPTGGVVAPTVEPALTCTDPTKGVKVAREAREGLVQEAKETRAGVSSCPRLSDKTEPGVSWVVLPLVSVRGATKEGISGGTAALSQTGPYPGTSKGCWATKARVKGKDKARGKATGRRGGRPGGQGPTRARHPTHQGRF